MLEQRVQLHAKLWKILNATRASDYQKEHVLGLVLYRYLSQDFSVFFNTRINNESLKYENLSDEEFNTLVCKENIVEIIKEKGLFMYPSQLFCNVLKSFKKNQEPSLGLYLDNIFKQIENPLNTLELESDGFVERHFFGLFNNVSLNKIGITNDASNQQANLASQNESIEGLIKIIAEIDDFNEGGGG
ncbi:type I restriction-modification system subunit M N-terminal domain-containing protein [Helicobacter cetorum]|uniref:Type I restriction enzyme m protein n=1 Tax=Helicobacter cetorum (strain ATCC BAA-429 / MIT 00-7128) TaxID=182217 RepID=I0EPT3_HELC0|nr:type I restriction-modification system subunit M N-terminal domain-containing protein [Helicobacter cetorum]AFI04952.1 type I restriction enzyme m protein [Helicobacter cetorum MIT 00-7128]